MKRKGSIIADEIVREERKKKAYLEKLERTKASTERRIQKEQQVNEGK